MKDIFVDHGGIKRIKVVFPYKSGTLAQLRQMKIVGRAKPRWLDIYLSKWDMHPLKQRKYILTFQQVDQIK